MKPNLIRVDFRRDALAVRLANLIGLVLDSKQNMKRDRWILREVWGIVEDYQIECRELCEQGLSFSDAVKFAKLAATSGDRKLWIDGDPLGEKR